MLKRIKLVFALTAVFIVAALFLGTVAPKATTPGHTPYASTLSNYAVGTAVAGGHCTNSGCESLQGITGCHAPEFPGTNCAVINGTCTMTPCKGH